MSKAASADLPGLEIYSAPARRPSAKEASKSAAQEEASAAVASQVPAGAAPQGSVEQCPSSKSSAPSHAPIDISQSLLLPPPSGAGPQFNVGAEPYIPVVARQSPPQAPQPAPAPPPPMSQLAAQQQQQQQPQHNRQHTQPQRHCHHDHHAHFRHHHHHGMHLAFSQHSHHIDAHPGMFGAALQHHHFMLQHHSHGHHHAAAQYHPQQLANWYQAYDEAYQQTLDEMRAEHGEDLDEYELDPDMYNDRVFAADDDSINSEEEAWVLEQILQAEGEQRGGSGGSSANAGISNKPRGRGQGR